MKNILLLCFFNFLLSSLSAQNNFSPGFIIHHNNDTLHGLISFRFRIVNPEKIKFLNTSNQDTAEFLPQDIKAFRVHYNNTDHYYESHTLKKDKFPGTAAQKLSKGRAEEDRRTHFLYVFLKGSPYSLFLYQDNLSHFYLQRDDEHLHKLPNHEAHKQSGRILPMEKYKRQLFYFLADWPEATKRISSTRYNHQSLLKIFSDYNHFKLGSEAAAYIYTEAPKRVQLGLMGGISTTYLNFISEEKEFNHLSNGIGELYPSPAVGLYLHLPVFNRLPSLSLYHELAYRPYKAVIEYTGREDLWPSRIHTSFDVAHLRLSGMLRWTMKDVRYRPFVQVGPWYAYTLKNENMSTISYYNHFQQTYIPFYSSAAVEDFRSFELGLSGGAGLSRGNFSAELRLDLGNGMSAYTGLKARTYSAGLFLSYRFL